MYFIFYENINDNSVKHIKRCWCLLLCSLLLFLLLIISLILIIKTLPTIIVILLLLLTISLILCTKITSLGHLILLRKLLLVLLINSIILLISTLVVSLVLAIILLGLKLILLLVLLLLLLLSKWILPTKILAYHSCTKLLLLWSCKATVSVHAKAWIWHKSFWLLRFCSLSWRLTHCLIKIKWVTSGVLSILRGLCCGVT